jgi:lipid II isoglutaminyl synthase (glutamine-hydrolysing)
VRIRIGHLYPDYLNIYADRGNIAVLVSRAGWRGHELKVRPIGVGDEVESDAYDLFYVGGGQDREQALVAPDVAAKGEALRSAADAGTPVLAVCGGYQLLGRFYRDRHGAELPGAAVFPLETIAGERRMIGDVLLECDLGDGLRALAGFENHAGRTLLDEGVEPLGRVVAGFGNDGVSGYEGCRVRNALGTYLHGPLLPRNPWLADWLERRGEATRLAPLPDRLEQEAHAVSAERARTRGGRF